MSENTINLNISELMQSSGVKFGTSGARGLASDMCNHVCYAYTLAFLQYLLDEKLIQAGDSVAIAGDYRPSSPRIMNAVAHAIQDIGCQIINTGFIPTPAVAYFAMQQGIASIMVTGSHIPDDRNGIKFYKPQGEILKQDEQALCRQSVQISSLLIEQDNAAWAQVLPALNDTARQLYIQRYLDFFPKDCLNGLNIGIYQHSTVLRDIMKDVVEGLGGSALCLGHSDHFIPVDTEAIRPEDVALAQQWCKEYALDALISADGDGDRPLISNAQGEWLRGDVAGILCAQYLQAESIVTPISSNSAIEKSAYFKQVIRTRIGSPYVIAAMNESMQQGETSVMGYEANGGFLIATDVVLHGQTLTALPTRDAIIVPLTILLLAQHQKKTITELTQTLPPRFTSSGRLKDFPNPISAEKLQAMQDTSMAETMFGQYFGKVSNIDFTDGVRITFENDEIVHLRASGNAPELRCYNEANTEARALTMNQTCLELLEAWR
ncbi:MAG: phosphomannomutase [Zetaproteobacteria bacterium]|nr:phosphomannomutase [Zetaproteobacteria bacterium]